MRPLNGNVLILEHKNKMKTEGGIVLPSGSEKRTFVGTVLQVGSGEKMENGQRYPLDVKVGDVVTYPDRVGDPVTVDGQEMLVIQEKYLLGVLIEAEETIKEDTEGVVADFVKLGGACNPLEETNE